MPVKIDKGEIAELGKRCICAGCPSYNECSRAGSEVLYCFQAKSTCQMTKYGCLCGGCPVQKTKGIFGVYFCINGKARP